MLVNLPNIIPTFKIAHLLRVTAQMVLLLGALGQSATAAALERPKTAQHDSEVNFQERAEQVDALFKAAAKKGGSFVVRYSLDGRSLTKGYGYLDCQRTLPMTADAVIDSGSITKMFTAAAIYKLVEQGRLGIDDKLGSIFSGVPADKRSITVAQLISHKSGLPDFLTLDGRPLDESEYGIDKVDYLPVSKDQFLRLAMGAKLLFEPGTDKKYSNFGYQLLAAIIEQGSGRDYERFVRDSVLLPAGMRDTGYVLPDYRGKPFADQCEDGRSWGDPVSKDLWKNGVSWFLMGAGGMMTTVADLDAWASAIASDRLFRPDIQARFRRLDIFVPSYRKCRTEVLAVSGSNGLTLASLLAFPLRSEALVAAGTRSDHPPPMQDAINLLCQ